MANGVVSKAARKAARAATSAAADELTRRTRANMEDLARFFSAREREAAVEEWLAEKVAALREQAGERREAQRRQCGAALCAMRDRGESMREIAHLAGVSENTVRELIRAAECASAAEAQNHMDHEHIAANQQQRETNHAHASARGGVDHDREPAPVSARVSAPTREDRPDPVAGVGGVPDDGTRQG